ncbi:hypothetical protein F5X99DRAFT_427900 [Biscogniauxia marginata]|nr:hypothetical protein F5X99DRAFT_427900 [Biscogniauxia marginata]
MVSFFGLKFGGERKQKPAEVEESGTKECNYDSRESFIDEKELIGFENACGVSYSATIQALPASDSPDQNKVAAMLKVSPYTPSAPNTAALSMTDLPSPHKFRDSSYSSLRQHSSNPNLGKSFGDGSSTTLALGPPAPISSASRPGTPKKERPKISPLDTKSLSGTPSTPRSLSSLPKSPLEPNPLNTNLPSDATSLSTKLGPEDVPEPLRIRRPGPPKAPGTPSSTVNQSPRQAPSSPQSIKTDYTLEDPVLEPPAIPFKSEARPSSRSSSRAATSGLKAVQNASDLPNNDETFLGKRPPIPPMNHPSEPVIQNVRGKWGTVKVRPSHRHGIEMPTPPQRSRTADSRQLDRIHPTPLDLDRRPDTPERKGPWNTPFAAASRSQTPTSFNSPASSRSGTPIAAVGAVGRPMQPDIGAVRRPTLDDYARRHESSDDDDEDDDYEDDVPESPDSPLIPLTGPLASPWFPPLEPQFAPRQQQPKESVMQSPSRSASPLELNSAPQDKQPAPLAPPLTTNVSRNPPTPDSTEWPLASPTSPSPSDSHRGRPESPVLRLESPLAPPRMPFARCESPKSPSSRSFSRPWTPTNDPMRRHVPGTPKRSETAPVPRQREVGGGLRPPPPRAATFNTGGRVASPKSAVVVDDNSPSGSGTRFI